MTQQSNSIDQIAAWAETLAARQVPPAAFALARRAFLDTLAVSLSGSQLDSARIVTELARDLGQGDGPSSVIGRGFKAEILAAALANGTAAHAELFDDNNEPMMSHPSASLVSALLPLGQSRGLGGADVLLAYVVGFEINVVLGRELNPRFYEAGWHVTRTLGVLGATAACCRLLGLSPRPFRAALGIAASMASGLRQNFGTMTMALHAGLTARDAVQAALLAEKGFLSDAEALDGRYGFFNLFAGGPPACLPGSLPLGQPFELLRSGIIFKPYPSGAPTHAAVHAALALHGRLGGRLHELTGIVCHVHPWNFMTLREGIPADTLRARVSLRYCVAAALRYGAVGSAQFTDSALADPLVQKFMDLVEIRQADDLPDNGLFPAAVEVRLANGETAQVRCDVPPGAPANPMSGADADRKYRSCASAVLEAHAIERTRAMILGIDRLADIGELCSALEGGTQS
ncbi:MAG: MmgE/PrpD family protein [Reyranella sp.]|uniref:MmgE/PrpD family protein n=1 Tax=Reyranella sp. TaxID=1929291 RepID=UPI003D0CC062